jgi:ABC-type bacteriocin/lantibiotic exporter with double-glycine peptidase domain
VTLWSLFAGVVIAMLFEFIARTVRGHVLGGAGKRIDVLLGDAVFRRVLATRLEARSQSSGAFANVLKEFESVRAFVASATLAGLADLPFALLFLGVTALIGGPLVAVPLVAFALVAIVSLVVQIPMKRIANENLRESAVRHGTVIESLEGLETLKALRAEERMRLRHEQSSRVIAERTMKSQQLSGAAAAVGRLPGEQRRRDGGRADRLRPAQFAGAGAAGQPVVAGGAVPAGAFGAGQPRPRDAPARRARGRARPVVGNALARCAATDRCRLFL